MRIEDLIAKYIEKSRKSFSNPLPTIERPRISYRSESTEIYNKRLRSIDKFLQMLSETPELWTRDVLIFLGIDKGTDQAVYLQKRSENLQRRSKGLNPNEEAKRGNPLDLPLETSNSDLSFR